MVDLPRRQKQVLDFIRDRINARGYGPTVREIADHLAIRSPNGVMCHLKALEKKGYITRDKNTSRGIALTDAARPKSGIPILSYYDLHGGSW